MSRLILSASAGTNTTSPTLAGSWVVSLNRTGSNGIDTSRAAGLTPRQNTLVDMLLLPLLVVRGSLPPFDWDPKTLVAYRCGRVPRWTPRRAQPIFAVVVKIFDRTVTAYFSTHSRFADDTAPNTAHNKRRSDADKAPKADAASGHSKKGSQ